ncbi:hypothetical protein C8F04DRAFT_1327940 [Mycena alexandri]|uniref:Uncharacterized protein n=1 Tax=Mycena alexandri TaxID=1745969 RepID=A0AAD6X769_9AGAR|nr:hypothetical protein C8F04DRAFT_1327940 [Mycena alexandri]
MQMMPPESSPSKQPTLPTYRRTLSPNELSYFLPSRAYGLNDMCNRNGFHAPPTLISPQRVCIAWAIMRLRHSLLACRVEMAPGCYDQAEFVYTPPSSSRQALAEGTSGVRIFDDVSGQELLRRTFNGPRILSSDCLARLDLARHGEVSPGIHEFHLHFMSAHMTSDSLAVQQAIHSVFELLAGPATPGGAPRTDAELAKLLNQEWRVRWGDAHLVHDAIVSSTEVRLLGLPQSKFCEVAWKVDNHNVQKKFIGGHVFPRTKSPTTNTRCISAMFDESQTAAITAKCKTKRVTFANAMFGLCNFAWIRLCAAHPELDAPKDLPMLMYTAINLRRYLAGGPPLTSYLSLALEYHNVVLPTFLPASIDPQRMFWARSAMAQKQMFKYAHSPLMRRRAVVTNRERGERAKVWARIDDEANGTLPRTPRAPQPQGSSPPLGPKGTPVPAVALLGVSNAGDMAGVYRAEAYPLIKLVDMAGGPRRGPGGLLVYTHTFLGRLNLVLMWDAAPFPPGLIEEFWRYVVDGVHGYVLEDSSLKGTAEEVDCFVGPPQKARAKM